MSKEKNNKPETKGETKVKEEAVKKAPETEEKAKKKKKEKEVKVATNPYDDVKVKQPMTLTTKIVLALLAILVVVGLCYLTYYLVHYKGYNKYEEYLTTYEYEQGGTFTPLSDSSSNVAGYDLVAENDTLKLYTDTATGYIAIFDKRNGNTVYSNPLDADLDEVANESNKNYLKSAFILEYYNTDVLSGSYDSYSMSVAKGGLSNQSIKDGIRYIYNIGDSTIKFNIPVEYRLSEDGVNVSIPVSGIEELGAGYVYRIQLLRYMGAAGNTENGYLVVPNNSGSLINFNNGKVTAAEYSQYVYDLDPMAANFTTTEETNPVKLPIMGICRENESVLISVEEGTSIARFTAGVSGRFNSYNYAYTSFTLRNSDNLAMFGDSSSDVYVMEPLMYDVNCTVRYTMLTDENKGYSGLANYYRDKLVAEGKLTNLTENGDIPFYYDVIGGVQETEHVLGVQHLSTFAMTTFNEAADIAKDLQSQGVNNQVMNFEGWFNKGYYHRVPDKVKLVGQLGSKSDLENLSSTLTSMGGRFYANVAFEKVTRADKTYNYNAEACRYYGAGYVGVFGLVNPTTLRATTGLGYKENTYNIMSAKFLPRYVDKFAEKINAYNVDGIALRDLGNLLSSDKKRTGAIDREQTLDVVIGQFDTLEGTGKKLMADAAFDYSFPYLTDIINAPTKDNDFYIVDSDIPLYEMIIHGSIDYSSEVINFYDPEDITPRVLNLIEYGAAPHYIFTKAETSDMKKTALNRFYATTYETWNKEAVDVYTRVNAALKNVKNATIVNHEIAGENGEVRIVTYSNGVVIYVNYGKADVTVNGKIINAQSYEMEGI